MPRPRIFNEEEVLQKAMELFWKRGYHATSIQDIVSYLGVNRASLYNTYGSKEGLFKQAFRHYQQTNRNWITNFLYNEPNVREGLYKLFEYSVDQSLSDKDKKGCFVVNATTELIPDFGFMHPILVENKREFVQIIFDYLQKGIEKGQLAKDQDIASVANLVFTLYNGLQVVVKVADNRDSLLGTIRAALTVLD